MHGKTRQSIRFKSGMGHLLLIVVLIAHSVLTEADSNMVEQMAHTIAALEKRVSLLELELSKSRSWGLELHDEFQFQTLPPTPPPAFPEKRNTLRNLQDLQDSMFFDYCRAMTLDMVTIFQISVEGLRLNWRVPPVRGSTAHSLHIFDEEKEIYRELVEVWFGEIQFMYVDLNTSSHVPGTQYRIWAALVGEDGSGEMCILSTGEESVFEEEYFKMITERKPYEYTEVSHELLYPSWNGEEIDFTEDEIMDHAIQMGTLLANVSFPAEEITTGPSKEDHEILRSAWSLLRTPPSLFFSTVTACSIVESHHFRTTGIFTEEAKAKARTNFMIRAGFVDTSCINGTALQQIKSIMSKFYDTPSLHQEKARAAMKSRRFQARHWQELAESYLVTKEVAIPPIYENDDENLQRAAFEKTLALFAEAASRVADNSLLKISLSHDGADETVVAALEAVLDVMRGENRHAYALVSHRRMAEILEKRARQRQSEFDTALVWNVCHPASKSVTIVAPTEEQAQYVVTSVRRQWLERGPGHEAYSRKLNVVLVPTSGGEDLRFRDIIYASETRFNGEVVAILNGDNLLGEGFLERWTDPEFLSDKVVALSRHSTLKKEMTVEIDSCLSGGIGIDTFIFIPPVKDYSIMLNHQNEWAHEYRVVSHFCLRVEKTVYNPCHEIKTYHMHLSNFRPALHYPRGEGKIDSKRDLFTWCPASLQGQEPPAPCCSKFGKLYRPYEFIKPYSYVPKITLASGPNNTVVWFICVSVHDPGIPNAPERGHPGIYLESGSARMHMQVLSSKTCLQNEYLTPGPQTVTVRYGDSPDPSLTLHVFLLVSGNEHEACEWVLAGDGTRSAGGLLDCSQQASGV